MYEYDSQGRLSIVWNPATKDMEKLLTEEAEENELPTLKELKENKYLSGSIQNELSVLVYRMNSPARITPMQLFIKEQYTYDGNGNRITKTTAHGTIKYWYDEENRLLATGSNGVQNVKFSYDRNGNLLKKESKLKVTTYAYNSENRIVYSEVRDIMKKTRTTTNYAYDALGRRLIVQDNGGTALRSVYDAFTFDVLKEAPTYENGLFTDTGSAGIKFGKTGKPTGERYRYLDDDHKDGNRYYYLEEGNWKNVSSRYVGTRNVLTANSEVVSQFKEESGSEYFIVDEFGSVKGTSDSYGNLNATYSYDAFGTLVSDNCSVSYGYAGKAYDSATSLYNFGYRDYLPTAARFTTSDPIRDGENWFAYCNGDPVNFVDLWGLEASDNLNLAGVPLQYRVALIEQNKKNNETSLQQKETERFSNLMRETVGANYGHTRMPTATEMDCSGGFVYVVDKMGYKVDSHTTANGMATGKVPGIVMYNDVSNERQGNSGVVNFYDWNQDGYIDHVNYGVGKKSGENSNQIVDASEGNTWQSGRNKSSEQNPKAEEDKINKTWSPFSTKTTPTKQGFIDFTQMEKK